MNTVVFSVDGQRIASGSGDSTVRIWGPANGAHLVVLRGHDGPVYGVVFNPDKRLVISASEDTTVRVWQCEVCGTTEEVLALAQKRVTRELTSEERRTFLHDPR